MRLFCDCPRFSDKPTSAFGEVLRQQVEERLNFFETGEPPSKNADAIRKVLDQLALDDDEEEDDEEEDEEELVKESGASPALAADDANAKTVRSFRCGLRSPCV